MASSISRMRFPRFDLTFSTETSDYHIVHDTAQELDNQYGTESIVSLTTKNAMGDDSSAFSFVLAGDTNWEDLLNDNDLVVLKIQPNELTPGQIGKRDTPVNDVVIVGLISEIRIEGTYENDRKLYRITGQSFQKSFIAFELNIIQQVSATIPGQGWMDADVQVTDGETSSGGDGGGGSVDDANMPSSAGAPIVPVHGTLTSGFRTSSRPNHNGIDIGVPNGTHIKAVQNGIVAAVGRGDSSGVHVIVKGADGYYTQYFHLQESRVSIGEAVNQGQTIALSNNTGSSTGPHLHFGVASTVWGQDGGGVYYNPVDYLGSALDQLSTQGNTNSSDNTSGVSGAVVEADGGFTSMLASRSVKDVFNIILDRFTKYMEYNFEGQGELMNTTTLLDRLNYSNLDSWVDDEHLMNPLSISSFEGSLNQLLIDISSKPFNEFYFESGYENAQNPLPGTEKSFLILRRTPFDREDWHKLHQAKVRDSDVLSETVSRTDLDAYSLYNVVPEDFSDSLAAVNARPYFSPKLVPKFGYKLLEVNHKFLGFMDWTEDSADTDDGNWLGGSNTDERKAFEQITAELGISQSDKEKWAWIINKESSWDMHAENPSSGAYGLPQANPSGGWADVVNDPNFRNSAYNQLSWMYTYMIDRYSSIDGAYNFWRNNNWY